jgi:trimeric autotransporter adhesin
MFLFCQLTLCGFSQNKILTTNVAPILPVKGAQAIAQAIGIPSAVAADVAGGFYFCSETLHRIYRVASDGSIGLIAGAGSGGFSGDGSSATAAQLNEPRGMAIDSAGNLSIADYGNNRIRKVTSAGIITTVAGNGTQGYSGDGGLATEAQLNHPWKVAVDSAGNLFIADTENLQIPMGLTNV